MKKGLGIAEGVVQQARKIRRLEKQLRQYKIVVGHFVNNLGLEPNGYRASEIHQDLGLSEKRLQRFYLRAIVLV